MSIMTRVRVHFISFPKSPLFLPPRPIQTINAASHLPPSPCLLLSLPHQHPSRRLPKSPLHPLRRSTNSDAGSGGVEVNCRAGPATKYQLHLVAELVYPDMVAVLLDHHADPNMRTVDGVTPLDILRTLTTLTSDFPFKGDVPGLTHIEPNMLQLCLEGNWGDARRDAGGEERGAVQRIWGDWGKLGGRVRMEAALMAGMRLEVEERERIWGRR